MAILGKALKSAVYAGSRPPIFACDFRAIFWGRPTGGILACRDRPGSRVPTTRVKRQASPPHRRDAASGGIWPPLQTTVCTFFSSAFHPQPTMRRWGHPIWSEGLGSVHFDPKLSLTSSGAVPACVGMPCKEFGGGGCMRRARSPIIGPIRFDSMTNRASSCLAVFTGQDWQITSGLNVDGTGTEAASRPFRRGVLDTAISELCTRSGKGTPTLRLLRLPFGAVGVGRGAG